jgi:hypothetical protein
MRGRIWLPSAMVARLASMAFRYQKVAGSSPAVVIFGQDQSAIYAASGAGK